MKEHPDVNDALRGDPRALGLVKAAYSVRETCELLSIGRSSLYAAVKRGELRRVKVGKKTLLCATDLVAFLTRRWTSHHVSFRSIAVEGARPGQAGPVANAE